jgi:hypothetical protein
MAVDTIDHPKKADMERWGAEAKVTGIYFGVPVAVPVAAAPAPPTSSRNAHMARRKLGTFPNLTLRPEKPALGNGGAQKHARRALWALAEANTREILDYKLPRLLELDPPKGQSAGQRRCGVNRPTAG